MTCFGLKIWALDPSNQAERFGGFVFVGCRAASKWSLPSSKLQLECKWFHVHGGIFEAPVDAFCSIHQQVDEVFLAFTPPTEPYSPNLSKQSGLGKDAWPRRSPYSTCTAM